ncbi:MAG: hypothetical protein KAT66_05045 [Candidatus Lokiarchaeota archaeon]|nr:hypothetical protein [Candidatus Lokiarchaeota archaeon]
MIPKSLIEKLVQKEVCIYVRNQSREFAGIIQSIIEGEVIVLENKYNLVYIPISEVDVITERR